MDRKLFGWRVWLRYKIARAVNLVPGACWAALVAWAVTGDGLITVFAEGKECANYNYGVNDSCYCGLHGRCADTPEEHRKWWEANV